MNRKWGFQGDSHKIKNDFLKICIDKFPSDSLKTRYDMLISNFKTFTDSLQRFNFFYKKPSQYHNHLNLSIPWHILQKKQRYDA